MIRFDRVVVVTLARRLDRLAAFRARLAAANQYLAGELEVEPAVDGLVCQPPDWWKTSPGAWGCYRSHVRIIEDALREGLESVLIFEDDATFTADFTPKAIAFLEALPADWGQAYLGGQHLAKPSPVNHGVVLGANINRTHAYALRGPDGLQAAYRWLCSSDRWRDRHHVDHQYGRIQRDGRLAAYAPLEWLCGQAEDHASDVSGKPVPARWWQPGPSGARRVRVRQPVESAGS